MRIYQKLLALTLVGTGAFMLLQQETAGFISAGTTGAPSYRH